MIDARAVLLKGYRRATFQVCLLRPRVGERSLLALSPAVKVVGLPRSGTNWVAQLIKHNFRACLLGADDAGWKHGPFEDRPYVRHVVVGRSIPQWLDAFYRWERIHDRTEAQSIPEFAASPVSHPRLAAAWSASSLPELWVKSLRFWMDAADVQRTPIAVVSYERLLQDLTANVTEVGSKLALGRRTEQVEDFTERADGWRTPQSRDPLRRKAEAGENLIEAAAEFTARVRALDEDLYARVVSGAG